MILPFPLALILAAWFGFSALSYEIVWARLFSFASFGRAQAFGWMLGFYLIGLAFGALWSGKISQVERDRGSALSLLGRCSALANILGFLIVPLCSWIAVIGNWFHFAFLILLGSMLFGISLPLLCQFAIRSDSKAGARLSYVYLANIMGSGAGSFLTGFVLMDWLKLWQIQTLLLASGLFLSTGLQFYCRRVFARDMLLWGTMLLLLLVSGPLHNGLYERLLYGNKYQEGTRFSQTVESRHGVVNVTTNRLIYGGGIYDGVIDTKFEPGSWLVRPYFISAVHPNPREVLVIGMASGAWTQILAGNPAIEKITVVEISEGYLQVVRRWPQVSSILSNPKVEIFIDDGRRWLRRNRDRKFDAVVMNTTFHWREFTSALLSREFLQNVGEHLKEGGIVLWNTTESPRAMRTGMAVFPHTMAVLNNCLGSFKPLTVDRNRWKNILENYRIDGSPLFDPESTTSGETLESILKFVDPPSAGSDWHVRNRKEMERDYPPGKLITEDNLGSEYDVSLNLVFYKLTRGFRRN